MPVATDCDTEFTQKLRSLIRRRNTLLAAVAVPGLVFSFIFAQLFWLPMIGSILICIFIVAFFDQKKKKLIGCVHEIEENMLASAFEMITHKPDAHIDEALLREVSFRYLWNTHRGSNLIRARYKGAGFTYSDVYLKQYGSRHRSLVFHGQWLILHLNKKIDSPLIVSDLLIPRNREVKHGCVKVREGFLLANQIPVIQTGNEAFDKQFTVLTEDPQMVSQLLTPAFMESILAARALAGAKMHLRFTEDRLHIAIYSEENFFRPYDGLLTDIPALRMRLRWEIDFLTRIMDEFVSNEELFKHM